MDQRSPEHDPYLRFPDGRHLGYAEYGDPNGRPLLFFHGTFGLRRMGRILSVMTRDLGIRVIAAKRPGYGLSDHQPFFTHRRDILKELTARS